MPPADVGILRMSSHLLANRAFRSSSEEPLSLSIEDDCRRSLVSG